MTSLSKRPVGRPKKIVQDNNITDTKTKTKPEVIKPFKRAMYDATPDTKDVLRLLAIVANLEHQIVGYRAVISYLECHLKLGSTQ